MTRRDAGFLLIGLGVGLCASMIMVGYWFGRIFIFGVTSAARLGLTTAVPLFLLLYGGWLAYSGREKT